MKAARTKPSGALSFIYRILLICFVIACLVFIGGTIYGVFFRVAPPRGEITAPWENEKGQTFTGIGRIRVPTKASAADSGEGMVILYVSFFYFPEDKAFSEELALRVRDFRDIISAYVASFSGAELQEMTEDLIKAELLRRFNAVLRLGQIEELFFTDFMIVG